MRHASNDNAPSQIALARLAGGLARPVDDDALRQAIATVLPEYVLGELDGIKTLPGMVGAAADSLRKAWRAGVDLRGRVAEHPRLQSIASLEAQAAALADILLRGLSQTRVRRLNALLRAYPGPFEGLPVMDDPALGLAPNELAGCVVRALSLSQVAALRPGLRPGLRPEFPVYGSTETDTHEEASAGIVDAIAFTANGAPQVVIDWKSDLDPSPETLEHYRAQVRNYLDMTDAERGLVVCVTPGTVIPVTQAAHGLG